MLFDRKAELPVATLHQRASIATAVTSWIAKRWQWFKPRSIPIAVAFAGRLGTVAAVECLSDPGSAIVGKAYSTPVHVALSR